MCRIAYSVPILLFVFSCGAENPDTNVKREEIAIEFLNGVYAGDPSVVDRYAAPQIVISYPIFKEIFGTLSIQGRKAVREFAMRFGERWVDPEVFVYEVVSDANIVVVVWGFRARSGNAAGGDGPQSVESEWGGITLYQFDDENRIVREIGEESDPGPAARVPSAFPAT